VGDSYDDRLDELATTWNMNMYRKQFMIEKIGVIRDLDLPEKVEHSRASSVNNAVTLASCSGKGHDGWDQDRNSMSFESQ